MGEHLKEITHGGADVVIDCVGMDGKKSPLEFLEQKFKLQGGTLGPIQISTKAVRKYGTVQMTGVYGGNYNLFPLGAFWVRNINLRMGQAPVIHFMPELFKKITNNEFDPRDIITHKMSLEEASHGYRIFNNREDECIKVVLKPYTLLFPKRLHTVYRSLLSVNFFVWVIQLVIWIGIVWKS